MKQWIWVVARIMGVAAACALLNPEQPQSAAATVFFTVVILGQELWDDE